MIWDEIFQKYLLGFSHQIINATRPLKDHLGIPFFGYHRIDLEGNYTVLTDRPDWAENYLENKFYINDPYLMHPNEYSEGVCFYSSLENKAMFKAWGKKVQADEGVILIEKDSTSVEFFIFGGYYQSPEFSKTYLNHLDLLKSFSKHFKHKVGPILMKQQEEGYTLPISKMNPVQQFDPKLDNEKKELFISSIGQGKPWKQFHSLTPREKDCLKQLLEGKIIKEIAATLSISPRTVEYYLENVKNKIDCHSKQDLIAKAKSFHDLNIL